MFSTDFWKKLRIYFWSLAIFTFLWVLLLAPSWQHLGCQFLSVKSSELYYWLIDLNKIQKSSHTGGQIGKTLKNNNFWLNQIQNSSTQIKKMKDEIFSFGLKKNKNFCQTSADNARHKNVPPPIDLTRILQSYYKMIEEYSPKHRSG